MTIPLLLFFVNLIVSRVYGLSVGNNPPDKDRNAYVVLIGIVYSYALGVIAVLLSASSKEEALSVCFIFVVSALGIAGYSYTEALRVNRKKFEG